MIAALSSLALLAVGATASPISLVPRDLVAYNDKVTIHESCNATQRRMLEQALDDTWEVATFAKEYTQTNGPSDPAFQLYFGTDNSSYSTVLGIWDSLLHSNKQNVLLRCDDIDGNCHQPGWRGHWRGENGSTETVICDASYTDRKYNTAFCMFGFELATVKPSYYWSIDLIHRLFHVPTITNGLVDHFAEDLDEVVELAAHNGTYAAIDSNALQYFAAHVYAKEVAKGGDACIGTIEHGHSHSDSASHDAASSAAAPTSTEATAQGASATTSAAGECHTHSDGVVHCA